MTKRRAQRNVDYRVDAGEDGTAFDRRAFFREAGVTALAIQFLPLVVHASGSSPSGGNEAANNLIIHTGPGLMSHVHDLLIPYAVLKTPPPQGVELTTTQALFHRHTLGLTQEELTIVNRGGTVSKKASSHLILIALANPRG